MSLPSSTPTSISPPTRPSKIDLFHVSKSDKSFGEYPHGYERSTSKSFSRLNIISTEPSIFYPPTSIRVNFVLEESGLRKALDLWYKIYYFQDVTGWYEDEAAGNMDLITQNHSNLSSTGALDGKDFEIWSIMCAVALAFPIL